MRFNNLFIAGFVTSSMLGCENSGGVTINQVNGNQANNSADKQSSSSIENVTPSSVQQMSQNGVLSSQGGGASSSVFIAVSSSSATVVALSSSQNIATLSSSSGAVANNCFAPNRNAVTECSTWYGHTDKLGGSYIKLGDGSTVYGGVMIGNDQLFSSSLSAIYLNANQGVSDATTNAYTWYDIGVAPAAPLNLQGKAISLKYSSMKDLRMVLRTFPIAGCDGTASFFLLPSTSGAVSQVSLPISASFFKQPTWTSASCIKTFNPANVEYIQFVSNTNGPEQNTLSVYSLTVN